MTTTERTPSQRAKANGDKGKRAERDVVAAFLAAGFPDAKRAVATGIRSGGREIADPGDVAGIPRTVVSVKDCQVERMPAWLVELDAMQAGARADYGLVVVKRRGHASALGWWAHLTLGTLDALLGNDGHHPGVTAAALVRLELAAVLPLLRVALDDELAAAGAA